MSENSLSFIAIIAILAVTIVLIRGLKSFFSGGDINEKKKSNKLMQMGFFFNFVL